MELQQLRYVVAVAETNSFTRAAERCLVVQSALSHQIARLERELGARLFERTSRRVRLTAAGAAFLPAAHQCLDAAQRAAAEVAAAVGQVRGHLRVAVIPVITAVDVPAALQRFHRTFPQVRVGLKVGVSEDLVEQIRHGQLDVAFVGLPLSARPEAVDARELKREKLVAVVAADHPLAAARRADLHRLSGETFVDWPAGTAGRRQSDEAFDAAHVTRDVAFEVSSVEHLGTFVREGLAVAMLPASYARQLSDVATLEVPDAPARREWLVWSRGDRSPAAGAFLDLLRGHEESADGGDLIGPAVARVAGERAPSRSRE